LVRLERGEIGVVEEDGRPPTHDDAVALYDLRRAAPVTAFRDSAMVALRTSISGEYQ